MTGYDLDDRISIPGRGSDFSLLHHAQSNSACYKMDTGGKVAGALRQPLALI
jgi:hypothetical protein